MICSALIVDVLLVMQTTLETVDLVICVLETPLTKRLVILYTVLIVAANVKRTFMVTSACAPHVLATAPMPLEIHMAVKIVHAHVMLIITV